MRAWLVGLAAALVLFVVETSASPVSKQDVRIPMDDGVSIAATLYLPDGQAPAGGWPAIVFLHALSGDRTQMNAIAEGYGFVGQNYAVLTFDARGHGESGGLVTIDGPREVADTRAVRAWLAARPDVADTKIGAWGISYGGGAVFNSLVAGVPWAAVATVQTWTNLYSALAPQGLVKTGLVAALAASIPAAKRDPSLDVVQAEAFNGHVSGVLSWAAERSSLAKLGSVTTPVFMAQGRRDFLFGIDQGSQAFKRLRGAKVLYVGLHGHAPSTFPAADTVFLMGQIRSWFDCLLRNPGCKIAQASFSLVPERFAGEAVQSSAPPKTRPTRLELPGSKTIRRSGKVVRTSGRLEQAIEIFGSPTVRATITASGGWSRLVAVLTARTPRGKEIVVSAGGVPTKPGAQNVTIGLIDQATYLPKGSRLTLTFASSSTAQASSNLLYLDLPMPQAARVRVGGVILRLPGLRSPVTK